MNDISDCHHEGCFVSGDFIEIYALRTWNNDIVLLFGGSEQR